MDEKRVVATVTFLSSLCGYFYAKHFEKDAVPIVMISGFFGAMLGESIYRAFTKDDNDKNPPAPLAA